jgi:hypothetical protein
MQRVLTVPRRCLWRARARARAEALRQLGAFYTARGSRAALTPEVRATVLAALRDAEAALA